MLYYNIVVGMGMGLVSEASAVELGIQTREDGEARVGIRMKTMIMGTMMMMMMWTMMMMMMMDDTDVLRFDNHLRQCWPPGQERRPMDSFNISPPGDCNCQPDHNGDSDIDDIQ